MELKGYKAEPGAGGALVVLNPFNGIESYKLATSLVLLTSTAGIHLMELKEYTTTE